MEQMTNSVLPALGMIEQFFKQKAKKKVMSDYTTDFTKSIQGTKRRTDLNTLSQNLTDKIYADDFLDLDDKNALIQLARTSISDQDKVLAKQQQERLALGQSALLENVAKNVDFSYNGVLVDATTLKGQVESLLGPNADLEQVNEVYSKMMDLTKTQTKSTFRLDKKGLYGQRYKVDSFGNTYTIGDERLIDDSTIDLTAEEKSMYNEIKTKNFVNDRDFQERLKLSDLSFKHQLAIGEANAERQIEKQNTMRYNTALQGTDMTIVDPDNYGQSIPAKRVYVPDPTKSEEENKKEFERGADNWKVKTLSGKIVENPIRKLSGTNMTESDKDRMMLNAATPLSDWYRYGTFDSDLVDWIDDNYKGLASTLGENRKNLANQSQSWDQISANQLTPHIIDNIVKKYNELKASNQTNENDDRMIQRLQEALGQNLMYPEYVNKQMNKTADTLENKTENFTNEFLK